MPVQVKSNAATFLYLFVFSFFPTRLFLVVTSGSKLWSWADWKLNEEPTGWRWMLRYMPEITHIPYGCSACVPACTCLRQLWKPSHTLPGHRPVEVVPRHSAWTAAGGRMPLSLRWDCRVWKMPSCCSGWSSSSCCSTLLGFGPLQEERNSSFKFGN